MFVDLSLARGLAKKHLTEWTAQGLARRKKFEQIVSDARLRLRKGALPSKSINKNLVELRRLFAQSPGAGSIVETFGRRSEMSLICPTSRNDGLAFSILEGHLNGRIGGFDYKVTHPLIITIHALERLHQRIGVVESDSVLNEIYSVVGASKTLLAASRQACTNCWPLLSNHGIFVAAVDGKTMCNAIDDEGHQTHVMSAVGHQSAVCYTQKKSVLCP
jgi:hypothetical protein